MSSSVIDHLFTLDDWQSLFYIAWQQLLVEGLSIVCVLRSSKVALVRWIPFYRSFLNRCLLVGLCSVVSISLFTSFFKKHIVLLILWGHFFPLDFCPIFPEQRWGLKPWLKGLPTEAKMTWHYFAFKSFNFVKICSILNFIRSFYLDIVSIIPPDSNIDFFVRINFMGLLPLLLLSVTSLWWW